MSNIIIKPVSNNDFIIYIFSWLVPLVLRRSLYHRYKRGRTSELIRRTFMVCRSSTEKVELVEYTNLLIQRWWIHHERRHHFLSRFIYGNLIWLQQESTTWWELCMHRCFHLQHGPVHPSKTYLVLILNLSSNPFLVTVKEIGQWFELHFEG